MALISIEHTRPAKRFDAVPFTHATMQEAPEFGGPWTDIETFDLSLALWGGLDGNPASPIYRKFSTTNALLASGFYRIVWKDGLGTEDAGDPVGRSQPGVLPPDLVEVRSRSPLLRAKYPENAADEQLDIDLQMWIDAAVPLIEAITCRRLNDTLPDDLVEIGFRAVVLKVEQLATSGAAAQAEAMAAGKRLRSISAGPWSESYFAPGELVVKNGAPMMDPDPRLHEALWALATEECREAFLALATGVQTPAGAVAAFDYRKMGRRVGGREYGPDGW